MTKKQIVYISKEDPNMKEVTVSDGKNSYKMIVQKPATPAPKWSKK